MSKEPKGSLNKYIRIAVIAILLISAGATVWATGPGSRWWRVAADKQVSVKEDKVLDRSMDEVILKELINVYQQLDNQSSFYMKGSVQATDPQDSSNVMNAAFTYQVNDKKLYCQLADQEMLSLPDQSITVNHSVRKIFVAGPKQVTMPYRLSADSLRKMVQADGYEITRQQPDDETIVIRLLRETHISCKEYTVTYDPATLRMKKVFMRLADMSEPQNPEKDKTVTVQFDRWEVGVTKEHMPLPGKWLRQESSTFLPSDQMPGYEVIRVGDMK